VRQRLSRPQARTLPGVLFYGVGRLNLVLTKMSPTVARQSESPSPQRLALSCDAVVLFQCVPRLVSKLSIFSGRQPLCDLIPSRCCVDPASALRVEIHQLTDLEFVFGHDGLDYTAALIVSIRSMIEGSSFSGLLTRVEIGHIHNGSAGNGLIRSPGSGSSLSHRA
jgi:hypothetical protein